MNWPKISARLAAVLFPAAGLYFCWWLRGEVGDLVAGTAFMLLSVNYFWIMRNLKKSLD